MNFSTKMISTNLKAASNLFKRKCRYQKQLQISDTYERKVIRLQTHWLSYKESTGGRWDRKAIHLLTLISLKKSFLSPS